MQKLDKRRPSIWKGSSFWDCLCCSHILHSLLLFTWLTGFSVKSFCFAYISRRTSCWFLTIGFCNIFSEIESLRQNVLVNVVQKVDCRTIWMDFYGPVDRSVVLGFFCVLVLGINGTDINFAKEYLRKYGYIDGPTGRSAGQVTFDLAVEKFQDFAGLPITGKCANNKPFSSWKPWLFCGAARRWVVPMVLQRHGPSNRRF